jgi:hypothetical protein
MATAKNSIQRRPRKAEKDKRLEQFLPTSVQKSYFMLSVAERDILNRALEKYRPGQSGPIFMAVEFSSQEPVSLPGSLASE